MTKQVWSNSSCDAKQGSEGISSLQQRSVLLKSVAMLLTDVCGSPFTCTVNSCTSYCRVSHTHEERGHAHLFLVKMYFVGPFALKHSLNFSSCGMPSTFIVLVAIVYFLLYTEDDLTLSLSREVHTSTGFSFFF